MDFRNCVLQGFLFLIIFLVGSIAPVSAELMGESYNNDTDHGTGEYYDALEAVEEDMGVLANPLAEMSKTGTYIEKRWDECNGWNFFIVCWDIACASWHLIKVVKEIEGPANKLKEDTDKLNNLPAPKLNNTLAVKDNNSAYNAATVMASQLSKNLQSDMSVETVNASEIKDGDIIQYLSQDQYYRYLRVENIVNGTNSTNNVIKQNKGSVNSYCPVLLVTGMGNAEMPINCEYYNIIKHNGVNASIVLEEAAQIQQDAITDKQNSLNYHKDKANTYKYLMYTAGVGIGILATIEIVTLIITIATAGTTAGALVGTTITCVILGVTFGVLANIFYNLEQTELNLADMYSNFAADQNDLNIYLKDLPRTKMDISTFEATPLLKQPPLVDWKNYDPLLTEDARHGDVLFGPGIQFLYGPHNGYTGLDSFQFQYYKDGTPKGIMDVNIDIQTIPTLNLTLRS